MSTDKAPPTETKAKKPHEWFLNLWFEPVSPSRMNLFVRAFALTFIIYVADWSQWAREWLTTDGYHIPAELISRVYPVPFEPMDPALLPLFMLVVFGAPLTVIFGPCGGLVRRAALLTCSACAFYIQLVDLNASFTLTKLFVVFFFLTSLAPDAKLIKVPGHSEPQWRQSAWNMRIIQLTLLIQYCTAGICKAFNGDWLKKADILYGHSVGLYRNWFATWCVHNLPHWTWVVQSVAALGFEAFAPVLFLVRRLRPVAFVMGIGMHVVIAVMMKDLILFSGQMFTFYILFLPYAWTDKAEAWWQDKRNALLSKIIPGKTRARSVSV